MAQHTLPRVIGRRGPRTGRITLLIILFLLLIGSRTIAGTVIDYEWWKELGQVQTWLSMYLYGVAPLAAATLLAFLALWLSHARALRFAGTRLREHRMYARIATLALLGLAFIVSASSIETWTIVRFIGSRGLADGAAGWHDPVFGKPLSFYLFDLPFYSELRGYLLALTILCALIYWLTARGWQLRYRLPELRAMREIDSSFFRLEGGLESKFLRGALVVMLLAFALRFFLGRYEMVWSVHPFLVGIDYVENFVTLPLQWLLIAACLAAAMLVWAGRWMLAASMALVFVISFLIPRAVSALHVRPNEISLEQPYIQAHIHATRNAYGLESQVREVEFKTQMDTAIDVARHRNLLDNVRLWDWRPFHDTVTQLQALRPYYVFNDSDVDRYTIDSQYRQVLLTPRELDIRQVAGSNAGWINSHFIYTHGYGLVLAEVSKVTPDGQPVFFIQNAPPEIKTKSLRLTRPEIYYGEVVHEPVFVHTGREEFNYPGGAGNVHSVYEGKGGFPIGSLGMRVAAAIHEGSLNILLTNYFTPQSRMMIRRKVRERLQQLAGFLEWDSDPYLVITDEGRLVWIVDGYTTSNAHPYSRSVEAPQIGSLNYIRNAVKATVDAYDGTTNLYIFAPTDPIILAYRNLFPTLFHNASEMPADLRAHARYPEALFRIQAEIYRTYHMLDPQSFYNKEDLWDLARFSSGQGGQTQPMTPTYMVASLPDQDQPEFILVEPFTPRSKDNLIGLMVARCDGEHLGELVVLQLSKQELIFGPMQIGARIDQEQTISKDLTLWNQQGSNVLRGQMLVLPVGHTFLYVEPIYIQSTSAKMPQLKKIVLAEGNRMVYADSYDQALAELSGGATPQTSRAAPATPDGPPAAKPSEESKTSPPVMPPGSTPGRRLESIRNHLRRYRDFAAQGRWAEAGKELEAIEAEAK